MSKIIPSTQGLYLADTDGNIWRDGHKRKPYTSKNGYIRIQMSINGKIISKGVHQLVAEAFYGPAPAKHDVCHLNHCRSDNRPGNLKYGTRSENCKMSSANYGHWRKGVKPACTKLKEHQYQEIVARYAAGAYQQDIAKEYGVTPPLVSKIIRTRFPR